jgi:signal transduction histidine kinase
MAKDASADIQREFSRLTSAAALAFILLMILQGIAFYVVLGTWSGLPIEQWLSELGVASAILLGAFIVTLSLILLFAARVHRTANQSIYPELRHLRAANSRSRSLRELASVLRATLSFERVVEEALNVCSAALEDSGIPGQEMAGAVFVFSGKQLVPLAMRRFLGTDAEKSIPGEKGIIGKAFAKAEVTVTDRPSRDPELRQFAAFQKASTAICIPLRAGFQIFGAMVIASNVAIRLDKGHFELFAAVADQAVIALQNAQLFQRLEAEKQRLIEADEVARKELARDLHDGPTQSIAAIAMRINFIRSLIDKNPETALEELQKVEDLAKQTSKEIRGMLFTLRPLVLETQGLTAAIETVMRRMEESNELEVRLSGGEHAELLNENAQSVVFSIVEEALGNARKYSEAKEIEVRFWREEDLFVASVQDDGKGFDVKGVSRDYSSRGSLGMVNMQERAERIDATLNIEAAPNKGTLVTLIVPLENNGREPHLRP